jgi:uncharacterized protein
MELAKTEYIEVRSSGIHHKGVFAAKFIPKGTRIIEYIGEKLTKAQSEKRADLHLEQNQREPEKNGAVYIFELSKKYDIDGNVPNNTAKYINHSCDPNAEPDIIRGKIWIIALKDIEKGEEITYDYGYDLDSWEDHPCKCGSKNCLGYIVGEDHREKLRKIIDGKSQNRK